MRRRRWPRRLLGALLLLVLLELALQAAAPLLQRLMSRRDTLASPTGSLVVLCVGDSNTYGLHLPHAFAYPAQLQARLAARSARPVTVSNRGVPGQNSAQVAAALAEDLRDTRADLVIVLAGTNDTWNTDAEAAGIAGLLGRLRLVRLARVLLAGVTTAGSFEVRSDAQGRIVVDRGAGERPVNASGDGTVTRAGVALDASVRSGLSRCLELCRDHGAVPVLMTYPEYQGVFAEVNASIRALAHDEGVLLVDNERDFTAHFARDGYEELMMGDHHPNLRGYQLLAAGVESALDGAGLLPARTAAAGAGTPGPRTPERPPVITAEPGGHLVLSGPPGWPYQVGVSGPPGEAGGFLVGDVLVPLADDDLLALSRLEPTFSGRFGPDGAARVALPSRLRDAAVARDARACLILLQDALPWDAGGTGGGPDAEPEGGAVAAVSAPVAVTL